MSRAPQLCCSIDEAVVAIAEAAGRLKQVARPVVAIAGAVGSGKSTLAARLSGSVVPTDNYLPDYERVPVDRRDEPDEADLARLLANLTELKETGRSVLPVWSFHEHRRVGELELRTEGLIVCEGLFALHPFLASAIDVRVLVRAPKDDRWARWARLEAQGERGWGEEHAREHFNRVADPTFERHLSEYTTGLDFLVENHSQSSR